jgi:RNA-binding protein YhbY
VPSYPDLGYVFENPIAKALEIVTIVGADTVEVGGKRFVIYDPEVQTFTTDIVQ